MKLSAEQIFGKNVKIKGDKTNTLVKMLIDYISHANENDVMPSKKDVSALLNISEGTVQNAYRILEDRHLVTSKQRIGTVIGATAAPKQTSKRDYSVNLIKKYMSDKHINEVSSLPSLRALSKELDLSTNMISSALKAIDAGVSTEFTKISLTQKIEKEIESYIEQNCKVNEKLPTLTYFSKKYNVSIKTVNDAIKALSTRKILTPYRGRYGTIITRMPSATMLERKEDSIFATARDTQVYFYEKVQTHIKQLIVANYSIGSKLPSIAELANALDVNSNTIRRALKYLEEDGYVTFERGRYGGTFVTGIPEENSYKWLAVNPQYVAVCN